MKEGEVIVVQSPGAGGYGDPNERNRKQLARDLQSGKYSGEFIERHYRRSIDELRTTQIDGMLDFEETLPHWRST